jgi:hypothetical protein
LSNHYAAPRTTLERINIPGLPQTLPEPAENNRRDEHRRAGGTETRHRNYAEERSEEDRTLTLQR